MQKISHNYSLKNFNTFGIHSQARYYLPLYTENEIYTLHSTLSQEKLHDHNLLLVGGGSNLLLSDHIDGLVVHVRTQGHEVVRQSDSKVWVRVQAGHPWDDFVAYCVQQNWGGLENLSLIPGTVGASPVQNIGAYGVEVKDCIETVETVEIHTGKRQEWSAAECAFGYRESLFKTGLPAPVIIAAVTFRLSKNPELITRYKALQDELAKPEYGGLVSLQTIRNAVIAIRSSKLPDPRVLGNAGSFFKNPVIPREQADDLQSQFPGIVSFPAGKDEVKLAAGWLIEHCGWKGFREGDAGVHALQALVLVNYGTATASDIQTLSLKIQASVYQTFGVQLHPEVTLVDYNS